MVSEKDLQSYLKVAASALPCREARKEFSSYVHNVAHDISIENPDADFATVASLLGTTPKQVAADGYAHPGRGWRSRRTYPCLHIPFG